jgi:hypothetical protein
MKTFLISRKAAKDAKKKPLRLCAFARVMIEM